MSEPIVFISNQRIKEGKLDEYTQAYRQVAELTEANKPGTVAHLAYVNEDGTEMSIVHVFPDAESMELHMQGLTNLRRRRSSSWRSSALRFVGSPVTRSWR